MDFPFKAQIQHLAEGKIDFEGQKTVETSMRYYLSGVTALAFIVGFARQSLQETFIIFGSLTTLLFLVMVPSWPFLNRNPVTWLPVKPSEESKKDL
ncbi:hypothetical protein FRB94_007579 [Tulasnella sp. JGI-2019a]|nr:hypothetical protein FRB93_001214 [Tulasnella sp. JGI-2019a]KAG8997618.1 hypothetical protein FRB94_007579 [Tulasnella sp. JGI-2019a]KAG9028169.1 hypothetical protein FRB95_006785 [Tulasnella sp. JGI-2019a]